MNIPVGSTSSSSELTPDRAASEAAVRAARELRKFVVASAEYEDVVKNVLGNQKLDHNGVAQLQWDHQLSTIWTTRMIEHTQQVLDLDEVDPISRKFRLLARGLLAEHHLREWESEDAENAQQKIADDFEHERRWQA